MKFAVFAKHLQAFPLELCVQKVAERGFDGLDLTVRPGGYVEPERLATDLPKAVKTIRAAGLETPLATTALISADEPYAAATIHTVAEVGIREVKLGYWPYDGSIPITRAADAVNRQLDGLEKLARAAGVRINLHNHSGDHVNNSPWVILQLLKDRDPAVVGSYFDPAHFTIEGALSAWRFALDLLANRVSLMAIKDNKWIDIPGNRMPSQERRWVPVGTGNVRWPAVFAGIRSAGFDGWASIHGEYQGRWSYRDLTEHEVLDHCTEDLTFVKRLLAGSPK